MLNNLKKIKQVAQYLLELFKGKIKNFSFIIIFKKTMCIHFKISRFIY